MSPKCCGAATSKHNPNNPKWADRDRFILSNGHGSMLLYSLLHLSGYDLSIDDLKNFRQLHFCTPGHPEYGYAPGIETTTGPLGQGITNAVGMAIAQKAMAEQFNQPGHDIVDHYTYAFMGDGCLMEGISHEACSLAGTLQLGKLIAFWDDNGISIDGHVEGWFTDDTPKRFEAYGWHVIPAVDGHSPEAINAAIEAAKAETGKPTLICCRNHHRLRFTEQVRFSRLPRLTAGQRRHSPLARAFLKWDQPPFVIPSDIAAEWNGSGEGYQAGRRTWGCQVCRL
ncbi:hypothetical protein ACLK1W_15510 [Escherichia coli]